MEVCGCGKEVSVCVCERVWYGKERGRKGEGGKKKKDWPNQPAQPPKRSIQAKRVRRCLPAPARTCTNARTHARTRNYTQRDTHTHTHAHPSTRTSPSRARACFGQGGTCLATSGCDRAVTRRMEPMKQTIYMTRWRICQQEEWRGGRPAKGTSTQQCSRMRERERDAIARDLRAALTAYSSKASNRIDRAC